MEFYWKYGSEAPSVNLYGTGREPVNGVLLEVSERAPFSKLARMLIRISPCWTYTSRPHHQATSHRQLVLRVRFEFSWPPCTKMAISPSYGVQIRRSWMRWKPDDETLLLILVLAPETSWIILCDHDNVLRHQFWAFSGLVSCRALSPSYGLPPGCPNPRTSLFA
jgi:hypothetical protein